jgi:hypothetical protein
VILQDKNTLKHGSKDSIRVFHKVENATFVQIVAFRGGISKTCPYSKSNLKIHVCVLKYSLLKEDLS